MEVLCALVDVVLEARDVVRSRDILDVGRTDHLRGECSWQRLRPRFHLCDWAIGEGTLRGLLIVPSAQSQKFVRDLKFPRGRARQLAGEEGLLEVGRDLPHPKGGIGGRGWSAR